MANQKNSNERMIFKNLLVTVILFLSVSLTSAQDSDYDFSGNWKTDQGPLILISKSGDTFKGVNVEHDKTILESLKFEDGKWKGILIKPKDGSKYDCTAVVKGDKLEFTVRKGFMSKTITWIKQ